MATRNIVLTDHQSQVVDHLVASGRYQNASEVLRAGLRMVEVRIPANVTGHSGDRDRFAHGHHAGVSFVL
ncbi:putative transcriptional regulator, CopG/Arc/MetJ family [Marinobacter nauticus VT8]|uniref:Antitoxin ParD n=1 Tax=Marinobacter nauticus (strain ATCC 700491 / DSM 11845 / VT8) TaxID=351348 RepID=A1U4Y5_MARN8|nr:putative transcriptional regulator, CopG/Arc/MetJ family [Marinobacter nauticus VT8]